MKLYRTYWSHDPRNKPFTEDEVNRAREEALRVNAFLDEIVAVCHKHGFSLSHEDSHGGFIIETLNEHNFEWLRACIVSTLEGCYFYPNLDHGEQE